jgi:hypothetical protein
MVRLDFRGPSWLETCACFGHNLMEKRNEPCVEIYGVARKLLPAQAHAVHQSLLQAHSLRRHVFNASEMGMKKTTMIICELVIQHIFNHLWDKYDKDLVKDPNSHEYPEGSPCPIRQGSIAAEWKERNIGIKYCVCETDKPSFKIKLLLGYWVSISIVEARKDNNGETTYEYYNPLKMRLIVAHHTSPRCYSLDKDGRDLVSANVI